MLEADEGIRSQLAECLRVMLDTSKADQGMEGLIVSAPQDNDIDDFLNMFYEKYMPQLMDPVLTIEADFSGKEAMKECVKICIIF